MKNFVQKNQIWHLPYVLVLLLLVLQPIHLSSQNFFQKLFGKKLQHTERFTVTNATPDTDIRGIYILKNPTIDGKLIPNDDKSTKAFLKGYDPEGKYIYLLHKGKAKRNNNRKTKKKARKKKQFVYEIVVLSAKSKLVIIDPLAIEKIVRFVSKYVSDVSYFYQNAVNAAQDNIVIIRIIPFLHSEELKEKAYRRYFSSFQSVAGVREALRTKIPVINDTIRIYAANAAAKRIQSLKDFKTYFKFFKGIGDIPAFIQLSRIISCEDVIAIIEDAPSYIKGAAIPSIEQLYGEGCLVTEADFIRYRNKYPNGIYLQSAFEKLLVRSSQGCGVLDFLSRYPELSHRFKSLSQQYASVCVRDVTDCLKFNELFNSDADIKYILKKAINLLPQEELVELLAYPRYRTHKNTLEKAFYDAIVDPESFDTYSQLFASEGKYYNNAVTKAIGYAASHCRLMDFCKEHPVMALQFKEEIFPLALNCISSVKDCKRINKVYNEEEDIKEVIIKALTNLTKNEFIQLISSSPYSLYKSFAEPYFANDIESIDEALDFLKVFDSASKENKKKVITKGLQFDSKSDKAIQLVLYYVREVGPISDLKNDIKCYLPYKLANDYPDLRADLREVCLQCINQEANNLDKYINIFNDVEGGVTERLGQCNAEEAQTFLEKYPTAKGIIEPRYPQLILTLADAEWFLLKFPGSSEQKDVLEKAMAFVKKDNDKKKLLAFVSDYYRSYGYSKPIQRIYLDNCELIYDFVERNPSFKEELHAEAWICMNDNKEKHLKLFPEDEARVNSEKAGELLKQAEQELAKSSIFKQAILGSGVEQTIVFNLSSTDKLTVLAFEGIEDVEVEVNGIKYELSSTQPVLILDNNEIQNEKLEIKLTRRKGWYKIFNREVKVHLYFLPATIGKARVSNFFTSSEVRLNIVTKIDQIATGNIEPYSKAILGNSLYESLRNNSSISTFQINELASAVAARMEKILDYYPKSFLDQGRRIYRYYTGEETTQGVTP